MAISLTAYNKTALNFNFTDSDTQSTNSAGSEIVSTYTYGTGDFQAEAGVYITGLLPSGGTVELDLTQVPEVFFGVDGTVQYSGIKFIGLGNASTVENYNMTITASGQYGLSGLFNDNSGNIMIKPYSTFSYNDPYAGLPTSVTNKKIQINDMGSGALYTITILGTLQ